MFDAPVTQKYGNKANVIKIGENRYAVLKYLLAPKYYKNGLGNEPERQITVRKMSYVLFDGEEIQEDMKEFRQPHILDNYSFPMSGDVFPNYSEYSPFAQQMYTSRWLLGADGNGHAINNGRGAQVFSSMRTGKSLACLWAAMAGLEKGLFKKILIVSPKTVMLSTWAKELSSHFPKVQYKVKIGVARDRFSNVPIDIIGWDALTSIIKTQIAEAYDLIIYDECTALKTVSTKRYTTFLRWFNALNHTYKCRLWILTGTPVAQSPENAYAFIKLISPDLGPRSLTAWRAMTQYKRWDGGYENKSTAPETCAAALQPSIRFELKDIIDIADCTPVYIDVKKTPKQEKMFKQLAKNFLIEMENEETPITAVNAAVKASKLLQILSGVIYGDEKEIIDTDAANKFDTLTDIIDQLPDDQPVVIFAEWTHTINLLKDYLTPIYKKVEIIDGSVGTGDKDNHRNAINQRVLRKETKIVILQPVTGSLGLDFSSTNVIIWFTPTYKAELYQQALDRVRNFASASRGFTKFFIYHLCCDRVERIVFESIAKKLVTQNQVFELIRETLKDEFAI